MSQYSHGSTDSQRVTFAAFELLGKRNPQEILSAQGLLAVKQIAQSGPVDLTPCWRCNEANVWT